MNGCDECLKLSRRSFLANTGLGLGALAIGGPLLRVAETYAQSSGGTGNLLVLCHLDGGMDALSFLAPYRNARYQEIRPQLALSESQVTPLPDNADHGIDNRFSVFSDLYALGQVAIVQQCAYPRANGSHFESQEIYEFGVRDLSSGPGTAAPWYERLRKTYFDEPFGALNVASIGDPRRFGYPDNTYRGAAQDAFGRLARLKRGRTAKEQRILETYDRIDVIAQDLRERTENFNSTGDSRGEFWRAAALASAGLGTQVIKTRYGGFDTHGSQDQANNSLFPRLNDEFSQFVDDLKALNMWDRTCICFYTEFGRRNYENGSPGTDHGHGGHMILVGPGVSGGLRGQAVTTSDLNKDSLPYYVDFRAVFSSCIRDWLGFNPQPIFQLDGETYDENAGTLFR